MQSSEVRKLDTVNSPFDSAPRIILLCEMDLSPGILRFPIKGFDLLIMRLFGELI